MSKCYYIAGPMRGLPEFNFPEFNYAADALRNGDHHVFNPAERDLERGFDPEGMSGNENLTELGFDLRDALAADTQFICLQATHLYMLRSWEKSSGARAEWALANALGLTIEYQEATSCTL